MVDGGGGCLPTGYSRKATDNVYNYVYIGTRCTLEDPLQLAGGRRPAGRSALSRTESDQRRARILLRPSAVPLFVSVHPHRAAPPQTYKVWRRAERCCWSTPAASRTKLALKSRFTARAAFGDGDSDSDGRLERDVVVTFAHRILSEHPDGTGFSRPGCGSAGRWRASGCTSS
ncbi:hypothetical protein OH77DRAFT_153597 [Trametes cingulata]|nr:hypothetical protein OH77DRAFT_153597 [Trametes cingulata]